MPPLGTFVAGAYSSTYNAVDTGITRTGYELQFNAHAEEINESDKYGDSLIDLVYRGGTLAIIFESKEYKAGSLTPFWPWGADVGTLSTTAAPIGRLGSNVAAPLVLSSTANTPAAAAPTTATVTQAILAPNANLSLLFDSKLRHVPIRLVSLPGETAGTVKFLALT